MLRLTIAIVPVVRGHGGYNPTISLFSDVSASHVCLYEGHTFSVPVLEQFFGVHVERNLTAAKCREQCYRHVYSPLRPLLFSLAPLLKIAGTPQLIEQ